MNDRSNNLLLVVAVLSVLVLGFAVARQNDQANSALLAGARTIDRELIERQLEQGLLSNHEAMFYRSMAETKDE